MSFARQPFAFAVSICLFVGGVLAAIGARSARGQAHTTLPSSTDAGRSDVAIDAAVAHDDDSTTPSARDAGVGEGARTCPSDMVLVSGSMCVNVDQRCLRWLDEPTQLQCAEFAAPRCSGRRRAVAVCMDRYEYPNRAGVQPVVSVSWYEARRLCNALGKRLCTETEWTFACEGENFLPYPYGLRRDRGACRIDYQPSAPDHARLRDPRTAVDEVARLYGARPSGTMPRCVSPTGIFDMTGNVDEWVVNEDGVPYNSALKGGWWGPIRARCRPATIAHNESFIFYQIGFRCCADPSPAPGDH